MLVLPGIPYSCQVNNPLPQIGNPHWGLWKFGYQVGEIPQPPCRTGTSRGGLRKFGYEAGKIPQPPSRIGTSHGGLRKFGYEAGKIKSLGMRRLISVSLRDTILLTCTVQPREHVLHVLGGAISCKWGC